MLDRPRLLDQLAVSNTRPPLLWSLVCSNDQLEAEGFGRDDLDRYARWKKGLIDVPDDELPRMGRIAMLCIVNGDTVR